MKSKGITKSLVWVLMGLLILGLGGFGVTNLSGTIRSVGSVGEAEIGINDYARALQAEIRARSAQTGGPVSFAQAQAEGLDTLVLTQLVSVAAFEDETRRLGISIGDTNLRENILEIPAFQGPDGSFDREAYSFALEQTGLNETQFEEDFRAESARSLLQAAVLSGVNTPEAYTRTLLNYLAERRNVTWSVLDRTDLATGLDVPTEEDLLAYHADNPADFTSPEIKRITYAWLTPEMIVDTVEVDDAALQEAYEARLDQYQQPERRLVERLGFADAPAAQAAYERITGGDATFEALVEERGLDLADVDMGDVRKIDLDSAGDAVFAAGAGDIVGPLDSPIGPALFRVNAVLQAQETSFEEALPALRDELAMDRARRVIDGQIDGVDDLLAGGATIEDLAAETDMQLAQIDWHPELSDDIAAYEAFRAAADAVTAEDYPDVVRLEDEGIFAMRLDAVVAPALRPLDEVRDAVRAGWTRQATQTALRAQVAAQVTELEAGTSFEDLEMATETAENLTRQRFVPLVPPGFIDAVFALEMGGIELLEADGKIYVVRMDEFLPPDNSAPELGQLREAMQNQAANGLAQDLYQALANDIRGRVGIELNQHALNAVHANFQ